MPKLDRESSEPELSDEDVWFLRVVVVAGLVMVAGTILFLIHFKPF